MTATIPTIPTTANADVIDLRLVTRREWDRQVERFRRQFKRTLNWKLNRGQITKEEAAVLTKAMDSDKVVKNGRTYAEQMFFELYQVAGNVFDNVMEWLAAAVDWMIENWETVVRVALTLLLMLI